MKSAAAVLQLWRNARRRHWRHVKSVSEEIDMNRLPIKQQLAFAALGTLASACTLALAVLVPLAG